MWDRARGAFQFLVVGGIVILSAAATPDHPGEREASALVENLLMGEYSQVFDRLETGSLGLTRQQFVSALEAEDETAWRAAWVSLTLESEQDLPKSLPSFSADVLEPARAALKGAIVVTPFGSSGVSYAVDVSRLDQRLVDRVAAPLRELIRQRTALVKTYLRPLWIRVTGPGEFRVAAPGLEYVVTRSWYTIKAVEAGRLIDPPPRCVVGSESGEKVIRVEYQLPAVVDVTKMALQIDVNLLDREGRSVDGRRQLVACDVSSTCLGTHTWSVVGVSPETATCTALASFAWASQEAAEAEWRRTWKCDLGPDSR